MARVHEHELPFIQDSEDGFPHGWSVWRAEDILSGYDRPPNVVRSEDEIWSLFADQERPVVVCGWCGEVYRTRNPHWATKWFHDGHGCAPEEVPEEAAA